MLYPVAGFAGAGMVASGQEALTHRTELAMSEVSDGSRELQISTSEGEAGSVLIVVSDSGPGLSPASVARMFEAFYTTKANGLGIGLSICRSIVDAHGGRLWATRGKVT